VHLYFLLCHPTYPLSRRVQVGLSIDVVDKGPTDPMAQVIASMNGADEWTDRSDDCLKKTLTWIALPAGWTHPVHI
jgi:hypothetical protein